MDVRDRSGLPAKIGAAVDNAEDADDFEDENDDLSVGWRRRESKDDWLSLGILLIFKSHHKLFLKERRRRLLWTCFASGSSSADGWMDRPVSAKQSKKCLSTINFEEMLIQCTRLVILTINEYLIFLLEANLRQIHQLAGLGDIHGKINLITCSKGVHLFIVNRNYETRGKGSERLQRRTDGAALSKWMIDGWQGQNQKMEKTYYSLY